LPVETLAALPFTALPFAGAAIAVSVRLMPQSGARAREKATRLLKTPRRKAAKVMKSFPSARLHLWLEATRIVNKGTTVEMGRLHGRAVEIACKMTRASR
jgi:hypothetical protein